MLCNQTCYYSPLPSDIPMLCNKTCYYSPLPSDIPMLCNQTATPARYPVIFPCYVIRPVTTAHFPVIFPCYVIRPVTTARYPVIFPCYVIRLQLSPLPSDIPMLCNQTATQWYSMLCPQSNSCVTSLFCWKIKFYYILLCKRTLKQRHISSFVSYY